MLKNFDDLFAMVQELEVLPTLGVVAPYDKETLTAVLSAQQEGLAKPLLIGRQEAIENIIASMDLAVSLEICGVEGEDSAAAAMATKLANEGEIQAIMKGKIDTSTLLREVVNKETGLGTGRTMTHVVINEVPTYHKLFVTTDGGMLMYPDLEQKKQIIQNAVEVLHQLGYEKPKVACLAAVEKLNPKMPETVDAHELKEMNLRGEITGCLVEGPISFDLAFSKSAAEAKGYQSEVAGDADIFVVPNITAGNILGKSLTYAVEGGNMAGIIYGAKVPIILTSRGASAKEKLQSIALASLVKMKDGGLTC